MQPMIHPPDWEKDWENGSDVHGDDFHRDYNGRSGLIAFFVLIAIVAAVMALMWLGDERAGDATVPDQPGVAEPADGPAASLPIEPVPTTTGS